MLGNPVSHSLSPQIHQSFAHQVGEKINYERILVEEGKFRESAERFLEQGGIGFNITVPCKRDAWEYARNHASLPNQKSVEGDQQPNQSDAQVGELFRWLKKKLVPLMPNGKGVYGEDDQALTLTTLTSSNPKLELAQAVNTIYIKDGQVQSANTDGPGLARDLTHNLGWQLEGARVLVLGAGGAVSGVLADLLALNPASLDLHNRTHGRAIELTERFKDARLMARTADELGDYDFIINGTGASLAGEVLDLPGRLVQAGSCCYDMMYGASPTPFMNWCQGQADCQVVDGLGMLVEQAALSFRLWFPHFNNIETKPVIAAMRAELDSRRKRGSH